MVGRERGKLSFPIQVSNAILFLFEIVVFIFILLYT